MYLCVAAVSDNLQPRCGADSDQTSGERPLQLHTLFHFYPFHHHASQIYGRSGKLAVSSISAGTQICAVTGFPLRAPGVKICYPESFRHQTLVASSAFSQQLLIFTWTQAAAPQTSEERSVHTAGTAIPRFFISCREMTIGPVI